MAEELRLALLGLPSIAHDGLAVSGFISSKAQALLYYLAVTGRPHSRESLAALFWGEMPDSNARANLRVTLCNLRQLFPNHLLAGRDTLAFNRAAPYWLDVEVFQAALGQLEPSPGATAETLVREAVALYCGEFLEGFSVDGAPEFEAWALLQREQLRQAALQALHALTIYATEQGAYKRGIAYAMQLLALDPWREEAHRQLMLLLAFSEQRGAALAQYETCRRILAAELGIEPLEETTQLYERIRAADLGAPAAEAPQLLPLPFAGRGDEHAWLLHEWKSAHTSAKAIALIEGEAGIGKTRLAEEMLQHARSESAIVLQARCYEFCDGVPYQPIADLLQQALPIAVASLHALPEVWLSELARLLPELHETAARERELPAAGDETARWRLFEAVTRLVQAIGDSAQRQGRALIFFLDDLHWCDRPTVDLLRYLIYHLHGSHVWILGAYRPEELASSHPLRMLRHMLGREDRLSLLQLGPLPDAAIEAIACACAGASRRQALQLATYLSRHAGGNPFFLSQLVDTLAAHGLVRRVERGWELAGDWAVELAAGPDRGLDVPCGVQAMILERFERLQPAAQRILQIASLATPRLDAELIDAYFEDRRLAADSLSSCLESRLLICLQPNSYGLALDLIRTVISTSILPGLRQQLQSNLRRACERLAQRRSDAMAQPTSV